jgi:hypothetical protein
MSVREEEGRGVDEGNDAVEKRMNGGVCVTRFLKINFVVFDARVAFQMFPPTKTTKNYFSQNKMKRRERIKREKLEGTNNDWRPTPRGVCRCQFRFISFCVRA